MSVLRLPSQLQTVIAHWLVPHYAAWWHEDKVGWLEFNVAFQHKYGYTRDEGAQSCEEHVASQMAESIPLCSAHKLSHYKTRNKASKMSQSWRCSEDQHLPSWGVVASPSTMMLKQWTKSCDAAVTYSASTAREQVLSWSNPLTDSASDDNNSFAWWWLYAVIFVSVKSCSFCFTETTNETHWLTESCGFTSHSTQNWSFRRRSPSQTLGWVWKD